MKRYFCSKNQYIANILFCVFAYLRNDVFRALGLVLVLFLLSSCSMDVMIKDMRGVLADSTRPTLNIAGPNPAIRK